MYIYVSEVLYPLDIGIRKVTILRISLLDFSAANQMQEARQISQELIKLSSFGTLLIFINSSFWIIYSIHSSSLLQ